jgi:ABC-type oligopeptide transport system ATPase subunit
MIKTKLILVDGISGSGKSTTAHFIARQMEKNGIKVKWYFECEKTHPLYEIEKIKEESDEDHSKRVLAEYPQKWVDFVKKIKDDEFVYIVESYLFQDVLMFPHFMNDLDRLVIKEYSHKILETARCLDPVLIHLYQKEVDKSLRLNWERRGYKWTKDFIIADENTQFCKNRGLKDKSGVIQLWQEFSDFTVDLFKEYNFRKIQIENSKHDWISYRKQILEFLELKNVEEILFESSFRNYCGNYLGKGAIIKIHEKDDRLCIDTFWPNLKLIPISENEFEIEGLPTTIKFHKCENTGKKQLTITKYLDLYGLMAGNVAEEYVPHVLSEIELEKFCGEYWCEAEKLARKLYVWDGKLYYCRDDKSESQLIPITDTQFMMIIAFENRIDFVQINGKWQFTFDVKGEKPTHSLFLRKEENAEK